MADNIILQHGGIYTPYEAFDIGRCYTCAGSLEWERSTAFIDEYHGKCSRCGRKYTAGVSKVVVTLDKEQ